MRLVDWREVSPAVIGRALAREQSRWRTELRWDLTEAWAPIEPARAAGRLPGFVVFADDGSVRGWTCFLRHGRTLQVAAIVSPDEAITVAMVGAIESSDAAAYAPDRLWFVRDSAPGLEPALAARGLAIGHYEYRLAPLDDLRAATLAPGTAGIRDWRADDLTSLPDLVAHAYASATDVRAFAPGGSPPEWREYVHGLIAGVGCGRFHPEASVVLAGSDDRAAGFVLTTALSRTTAHLAQVAVLPDRRGRGAGRALVETALVRARALGYREASLLVSATNTSATRLYDKLGFQTRAGFIAGVTAGIWRQGARRIA